jgi:curved DNA-binding protein CbpA
LFKDYYKILEVSRNATADEIKIGYRNLAKKYHPDANIPNFNFNAIMQEINEAYEVLKDDNKRKNYNSQYANELKNSSQMPKECIENENKLKSENAQLKTQYANELNKTQDLNNRINSLTSELNNTKTQLSNEIKKTQDLNNRINSLTSELNNTKTELNNTKTQLNNTKTQLSNEIKKSADLNNRINSLTSELNNTKTQLNNTKTQLANELNKSLTSELINYLMKLFLNENKRKNYNSQYANELKNSSQNSNFIIWNGKDIKDFGAKPEVYGTYKEFVKDGFIEDEFETVAESEEQLAKSGMLNAYFGVQNINMKYTADKTEFDVSINGFANFKITIQRNIAREFKEQVKSFDFNFDRKLQLDSISVLFNNQLFYGRDFNKDLLVEKERLEKERLEKERLEKERLEKERQIEIASKTITIGNLMFQDAELPNKMNWNDACKYCENLRLLGFSDWRLPTIEELRIAYQHKSEFRNMQNDCYWSSTISKTDTSSSWNLYFGNGNDYGDYQSINGLFRCVR